jgi:hypothetical protein
MSVTYNLTEKENKLIAADELENYFKTFDSLEQGDIASDLFDNEQLQLLYHENYTVKGLNQILQYYGIYKAKMTKDEIIQTLIFFETDLTNHAIVLRRMRLWQNAIEMKADPFFSKFILFQP